LETFAEKTVLCLGCGAGEECAYIKSLGAKKVIGIDISKSLINTAKESFPEIEFSVMDMEKLKLPKSSFDFVYSSLVMHYVKDWTKALNEVRKVLKTKGTFLFSTHDPVYWSADKAKIGGDKFRVLGYKKNIKTGKIDIFGDYLNVRKINDVWFDNFKVTYYHKPFSSIMKDILKSGFTIIDCIEPKPLSSAKKIDFEFWSKSNKLPLFIIFKLEK
jgi:ubiquinone/menaquinone biosynthesis C-methylase UbiE